jgi:hypothetical protein
MCVVCVDGESGMVFISAGLHKDDETMWCRWESVLLEMVCVCNVFSCDVRVCVRFVLHVRSSAYRQGHDVIESHSFWFICEEGTCT